LLSSNISSTSPHNMVNFGTSTLTAEIGWRVLGTPANFNGFRLLAFTAPTLLNGGQPNFARCLAVFLAGTLYIHFGGSCLLTEFCQVQNSLCKIHFVSKSCVLLYWLCYCTALEQWASAKLCGVVAYKEWNYGTFAPRHFQQRAPPIFRGRPSRWA